jgi:DNA-binding CsgD family transcriptional regulator
MNKKSSVRAVSTPSQSRVGQVAPVGVVIGPETFVCEAVAYALSTPTSPIVAMSATEATALIRKGGPHLVVVLGSGSETLPLIKAIPPGGNLHLVIATSDEVNRPRLSPTVDVMLVTTFQDLVTAVDRLLDRKTFVITERSKEILQRLAKGDSPSQAADFLGISVGTLSNQLSVIYRQMNVHNVTDAVLTALRQGLIDL